MIEVIRSRQGLGELADEWNSLTCARQHPLLRHEWFASSAEAFVPEDNLFIVTLRTNGRLRAVAPLALVRRHGIKRLELMGASVLHEPSGLLYDDADSLAALCTAITRLPQPIVLQRIADASKVINWLSGHALGRGKLIQIPAASAPFIEIRSTWERYYQSLSSRRRYDFRRARTRLERVGTVSVEFISPNETNLDLLMNEAMRIESSGWKSRAGSALMFNQSLQHFMRTFALRACRLGILQLCYLKVDNVSIATQIGIRYANRYWVLKIGYDEHWAEYSPGMQLTMEAVKFAFDQQLNSYEFLGTDEPWLRIWTKRNVAHSTLLYYSYGVRGLCALGADIFVHLIMRTIRFLACKKI